VSLLSAENRIARFGTLLAFVAAHVPIYVSSVMHLISLLVFTFTEYFGTGRMRNMCHTRNPCVSIDMAHDFDSLNVSVSSGIVLHHLRKNADARF
jgi:hypothetical protein